MARHQERPGPSWTVEHGPVTRIQARYRDVRCAACQQALNPVFDDITNDDGSWDTLQADDALRISFSGGYGEFLDTIDGPASAYLCRGCAINLLQAQPWMASLVQNDLNINIGHTCDGEITWTPMPECPAADCRAIWS